MLCAMSTLVHRRVLACSRASSRQVKARRPRAWSNHDRSSKRSRPAHLRLPLLSKMSGCRCAKTTLAHAILFLLKGLSSLATRQYPQDTPCSLCEAIPTCTMARTWFVQTASLSFHGQALVEPRDFPLLWKLGSSAVGQPGAAPIRATGCSTRWVDGDQLVCIAYCGGLRDVSVYVSSCWSVSRNGASGSVPHRRNVDKS
jgi:hypothetical protein